MQQLIQEIKNLTSAVEKLSAAYTAHAPALAVPTETVKELSPVTPPAKEAVVQPAAVEPTTAPAVQVEEAKPEISLADVKTAVIAYDKKNGIEATRKLLAKYFANRISEIKPEHFEAIIKEAAHV